MKEFWTILRTDGKKYEMDMCAIHLRKLDDGDIVIQRIIRPSRKDLILNAIVIFGVGVISGMILLPFLIIYW
jgi:hypothetical protein